MLDFGAQPSLQALANRWRGRVNYVAGEARDRLGLIALLVRPDGIVAWAGEQAAADDEVSRAAARWFGEPNAG